jgi:hypothetical protein
MQSRTLYLIAALVVIVLSAACVPAQIPEELAFTPGPPVTVSETTYQVNDLRFHYPAGWRVVTGPAENPLRVVFVSPAEDAIIVLSPEAIENPPVPAAVEASQAEVLADEIRVSADTRLHVLLVTTHDRLALYRPAFEFMISTLTSS